jgi:hypothetical protein
MNPSPLRERAAYTFISLSLKREGQGEKRLRLKIPDYTVKYINRLS